MMASFILSRTLVPTMAMYLLKPHEPHAVHTGISAFFVGIQRGFEGHFERLRAGYIGLLRLALPDGSGSSSAFSLPWSLRSGCCRSWAAISSLGRFRPDPDARARADGIADRGNLRPVRPHRLAIREIIPPAELTSITDNIGLPVSAINVTYNNSGTIGRRTATS
jgi:hypothetical protein